MEPVSTPIPTLVIVDPVETPVATHDSVSQAHVSYSVPQQLRPFATRVHVSIRIQMRVTVVLASKLVPTVKSVPMVLVNWSAVEV